MKPIMWSGDQYTLPLSRETKRSGKKDINNTIKNILTEQSNANNVTVYFTYTEDAYFVFVTDHLGTQGYTSKYYFEQFGKQIIIGYKNEELERRFANPKAQKKKYCLIIRESFLTIRANK